MWSSRSPGPRSTSPIKMASRLLRRMPSPRKPASTSRNSRRVTTPKGEYIAAKVTKKGRSAAEILAEGLPKELSTIYWPKNMYWHKPNERFVRPVRWLVAMLDGETIPLEFDGIRAGKTSRGHRILSRRRRDDSAGRSGLCRLSAGGQGSGPRGTRASDSQGARRRDAHDSRRTLARRQSPARYGRESDRVSFGDSGQFRSAVPRAAGRSAGHGDARSPEIFRGGRCRRQTGCRISWRC